MIKSLIRKTLKSLGYNIIREKTEKERIQEIHEEVKRIADADLYVPTYSPWLGKKFQTYCLDAMSYTLVSPDRLWILYSLSRQALALDGDFVECGVYKGGTALLLARIIEEGESKQKKTLHLFDTFEGMPEVNQEKDLHRKGDFCDTSLKSVRSRLSGFTNAVFHQGILPGTFREVPDIRVSFVHIDVDIFDAILGCCDYLYSRMAPGGFMVFDDYGFESCPGAREAVDKWFSDKPEVPLILPTGQAVIIKLPSIG